MRLGTITSAVAALSHQPGDARGPGIPTICYGVYDAVQGYLNGLAGPLSSRLVHATEVKNRATREERYARADIQAAVVTVTEAIGLRFRHFEHKCAAQAEASVLAQDHPSVSCARA